MAFVWKSNIGSGQDVEGTGKAFFHGFEFVFSSSLAYIMQQPNCHHICDVLQEWKNNVIFMFVSTQGKSVHSKITKFRKEPTSFEMLCD